MNIEEVLTRRIEKILPSKEGLAKLMGEKKIRLYQGFDPTGARLHLGHSVGIRKLMDFANAGHEVIFLFGTGTVLVGDPSQRDSARKIITQEEINENIKDWKRQTAKLIDFDKVKIKQNGDWLTKLNLKDIIQIASNISAVQLFKREMFQRRLAKGDTVWYHETMYPLLQGYDSVVMDVDLEIGGTDQEFNMLIGRELQRKMNNREKFVLTTPMIVGTDGKQMSKTSGNCVWLNDNADEMFGKIMSLPDDQIVIYMEMVTDIPLSRIEEVKRGLLNGSVHPMEAKKELAMAVVAQFNGIEQAKKIRENFERTFQERETPKEIPALSLSEVEGTVVDLLEKSNLLESRGEIKRLIDQKGISINELPITDYNLPVTDLKTGDIIKIGKRKWLKLI